jgi:hypothetical protein
MRADRWPSAALTDLARACQGLGVQVVGCGVAMLQGERWREKLGPQRSQQAVGVLRSPLLQAVPEGWALRD